MRIWREDEEIRGVGEIWEGRREGGEKRERSEKKEKERGDQREGRKKEMEDEGEQER